MGYFVANADVSDFLRGQPSESFDGCLTDPPYGLSFMGKAWDHGVPSAEVWREVHRVLKPGAFLLAFGGTRTFHRLTCAIEDAGFGIRDCVCWLYGSGFPKSHNFGRAVPEFDGYGTALKPAWEPCIVAMKPCAGTFAENALRHGVAGINVDESRIETGGETFSVPQSNPNNRRGVVGMEMQAKQGLDGNHRAQRESIERTETLGRWPANLILDAEAGAMLDAQAGDEVSRFFYTAKASRGERDAGMSAAGMSAAGMSVRDAGGAQHCQGVPMGRNHHPCLKPLDLNRYLAALILPPKRDTPRRLLTPFCGSGSEMIGGMLAGWDEVIGIELESDYCEIANARLSFFADAGIEKSLFD